MYICGASLQKLAFYADTANPEASNSKAVLFTNPPHERLQCCQILIRPSQAAEGIQNFRLSPPVPTF